MIGSHIRYLEKQIPRDSWDYCLWKGREESRIKKRRRRKSWSAMQAQRRPQQTQQGVLKLGVVLQSCPKQLRDSAFIPCWLDMRCLELLASLAEAVCKEGWHLTVLPKPRELSYLFPNELLSSQDPLLMVQYFGNSRHWGMLCG